MGFLGIRAALFSYLSPTRFWSFLISLGDGHIKVLIEIHDADLGS